MWYSPSENMMKYKDGNGNVSLNHYVRVGLMSSDANRVTALKPRRTFKALDYNEKEEITTWAFPSGKYKDLTLGASGATYTAPADGWYCLYMGANAAAQYAAFRYSTGSYNSLYHREYAPASGNAVEAIFPAAKGGTVQIAYTLGGTVSYFRFVYAKGAESEV